MLSGTAKPGTRVRVILPRGGGRLMRKEAATRLLLDVARQLRFKIELQGGDATEMPDGARLKPPIP